MCATALSKTIGFVRCCGQNRKWLTRPIFLLIIISLIITLPAYGRTKIPANFVSLEAFYYNPNFKIDEPVMLEGYTAHFFTTGFTPWVCYSLVVGECAAKQGVGWEADIAVHRATGRLNYDIPELNISFPSYRARITGLDLMINANYLFTIGPLILVGYTGSGLSLNSFAIYEGDAEESAYFTSLAVDYGLRVIYKISKSFRLSAGYRGYVPTIGECGLEPGLILHPQYRPYDITLGINYFFNRISL